MANAKSVRYCRNWALAALGLSIWAGRARAQSAIPDQFLDPESGLRIVHVSRVPTDRSGVIYFTQNSITADSRRVLFHTQTDNAHRHLYTFDLQTHEVVPLVTDRMTANQVFSPVSDEVYYLADQAVCATNIDTRQSRKIADLPPNWSTGAGLTYNADETLLAGSTEEGSATSQPDASATPSRSALSPETARLKGMSSTFNAHRPNLLYTVNIKTGEVKVIHRINTWLGHVQFSPTDPKVLMFCHEGPWEKVDRIWTIDASGGQPTCTFLRSEPNEIAGHEFWSPDGTTIWFQHTFRTRKIGYLAGKNMLTGKLTQYLITPEAGAIHQTISWDEKYFVGDGGKNAGGAAGPHLTVLQPDGDRFKVTNLCSFKKNDYSQCEPNPHLTPDQHWVIFTATFTGTPQAWALEMPKQFWK
jgi:oligogalacturonide lyase